MREFAGGRLNTTAPAHGRGKMMMPTTKTNKECKAESGKCFVAGDIRASEQPALAAMHTIFLREHNRMVDEMARVSQHWNKNMSYGQGFIMSSSCYVILSFNQPVAVACLSSCHHHFATLQLKDGRYQDLQNDD